MSRLPDVRSGLGLDNGALGLLLLAMAIGSVGALPVSGRLIDRYDAATVTRLGAVLVVCGLTVAVAGVAVDVVAIAAVGLFVNGVGTAVWDVSMNVEAAEVERRLRSHDHAALPRRLEPRLVRRRPGRRPDGGPARPLLLHVPVFTVLAALATWRAAAAYLPPPSHTRTGRRCASLALAGAADPRHRDHGAGLRPVGGLRERLARAGPDRRLTSRTGSASRATPCS